MATEMVAFSEMLSSERKKWEKAFKAEFTEKDYDFYGMVAGIKRPEKAVLAPKGLPADCDPGTLDEYNKSKEDNIGASYVDLLDLKKLDHPMARAWEQHINQFMPEKGRIVFWFIQ